MENNEAKILGLVAEIRREVSAPGAGPRAEGYFEELSQLNDPACIALLLLVLNDDLDDVNAFDIVHFVEAFDHETYCREVLRSAPLFSEKGKRWPMIILLRIANNAACREEFVRQFKTGTDERKNAVLKITADLVKWRPAFEEKLLKYLSPPVI